MPELDPNPFQIEFVIIFRGTPRERITVGEGWFELLWGLCAHLEAIARSQVEADEIPLVVLQIKEKFGLLRIYVSAGTPEAHALIDAAEKASGGICEACGRPGNTVAVLRHWYQTLCPGHEAVAKAR